MQLDQVRHTTMYQLAAIPAMNQQLCRKVTA